MHRKFSAYRTSHNREFFRVPVCEAVSALQEEANTYRVHDIAIADLVSALPSLRLKYKGFMKPDIVDIAIVQLSNVCYVEVVRQAYENCRDRIVEQMDLAVFGLGDKEMFLTTDSITKNAQRFLNELDDYDLIMTGVPFLTSEACQKIADEWQKPGGKLEQLRS